MLRKVGVRAIAAIAVIVAISTATPRILSHDGALVFLAPQGSMLFNGVDLISEISQLMHELNQLQEEGNTLHADQASLLAQCVTLQDTLRSQTEVRITYLRKEGQIFDDDFGKCKT